jgi:transcriptional regulator of arginine metabolism
MPARHRSFEREPSRIDVMKQTRQAAIRDLLRQRPIRTQHDLAAALRERGFRVTQATISRDVGELGLVKADRDGVFVYTLPPRGSEAEPSAEDRLARILRDLPVHLDEAGLLLVIRTLPGSAHAIASWLDRTRWREVVGTIAGDDTLFVAFRDRPSLEKVRRRLERLQG